MITVDGIKIKTPTTFTWGLQDISDDDSGRTQDMLMHKNRIAQKRNLNISWNITTPDETAILLQAFNPEYIQVKYPDAMSGKDETRTFYVGDKSAPVRTWVQNNKRYTTVGFDLIER